METLELELEEKLKTLTIEEKVIFMDGYKAGFEYARGICMSKE